MTVPASAAAERTPDGPATLISSRTGSGFPRPATAPDGRVLTSWTVTVGPGGRAGTVRPLVGGVVGDPVDLPATPGTYTFALAPCAPAAPLGLVQETGGHAIVTREACRPAIARSLDPCETKWVDIQRAGQGTMRDRGAQLRGRVQFRARRRRRPARRSHRGPHRPARQPRCPSREPDGRLRRRRDADQRRARRRPTCRRSTPRGWRARAGGRVPAPARSRSALSTPLAAGRVALVRGPRRGPDRHRRSRSTPTRRARIWPPADNSTVAGFLPAPAFDLVAAEAQRLSRGIKVQVRGVAAGPARLIAAFRVRGPHDQARPHGRRWRPTSRGR